MNAGPDSLITDGHFATLLPGDVHVFRLDLERDTRTLSRLEDTLNAEERQRAARFRAPVDQQRFIAARGAMRLLLGSYLHQAPGDVQFHYGANGKPALAKTSAIADLRFNLSHSHTRGLLAVTLDREIGVDIEWMRPLPDALAMAQRFFSPGEYTTLLGLTQDCQQEGFFACWTRKEAYLKALGGGLSIPLDQFEVSLKPEEPARLLRIVDEPKGHLAWSLHDLPQGSGYRAALAVQGTVSRIYLAQYPDTSCP